MGGLAARCAGTSFFNCSDHLVDRVNNITSGTASGITWRLLCQNKSIADPLMSPLMLILYRRTTGRTTTNAIPYIYI